MKPRAWPLLIVLLACATPRPEGLAPSIGGSLAIDVYPNPIIANQVRADLYQFPFEVSLRETGGMDVEIDGIRIEVRLAALRIFAQAFDETELTRRGYSATVPAGSNVQVLTSARAAGGPAAAPTIGPGGGIRPRHHRQTDRGADNGPDTPLSPPHRS